MQVENIMDVQTLSICPLMDMHQFCFQNKIQMYAIF